MVDPHHPAAIMLEALLWGRTDRVIGGTNTELSARRVAVKPPQPQSGAPQAQGLASSGSVPPVKHTN